MRLIVRYDKQPEGTTLCFTGGEYSVYYRPEPLRVTRAGALALHVYVERRDDRNSETAWRRCD